jgi:hypothetical protein
VSAQYSGRFSGVWLCGDPLLNFRPDKPEPIPLANRARKARQSSKHAHFALGEAKLFFDHLGGELRTDLYAKGVHRTITRASAEPIEQFSDRLPIFSRGTKIDELLPNFAEDEFTTNIISDQPVIVAELQWSIDGLLLKLSQRPIAFEPVRFVTDDANVAGHVAQPWSDAVE